MNEYHRKLAVQIDKARAHIRQLKRVSPYIFPEWSDLHVAKAEVKRANAELKRAAAAWKRLGAPLNRKKE